MDSNKSGRVVNTLGIHEAVGLIHTRHIPTTTLVIYEPLLHSNETFSLIRLLEWSGKCLQKDSKSSPWGLKVNKDQLSWDVSWSFLHPRPLQRTHENAVQ